MRPDSGDGRVFKINGCFLFMFCKEDTTQTYGVVQFIYCIDDEAGYLFDQETACSHTIAICILVLICCENGQLLERVERTHFIIIILIL